MPSENLLQFRVQDGWGPLCKFLGINAPDTEFPNGNTTEEVQEKTKQIVRREIFRAVKIISGWILIFSLAAYWFAGNWR